MDADERRLRETSDGGCVASCILLAPEALASLRHTSNPSVMSMDLRLSFYWLDKIRRSEHYVALPPMSWCKTVVNSRRNDFYSRSEVITEVAAQQT
jgi:hypothetical protein